MFDRLEEKIRSIYPDKEEIHLHEPVFWGNEKKYLSECIDSSFVSYLGKYVSFSENAIKERCGVKHAIACVSGTAALHLSLITVGVEHGDLVLMQALNFVATANAVSYIGASPVFLDSAFTNLGLCPKALLKFLESECFIENNNCIHKPTGRRVKACVPMHVFGYSVLWSEIQEICEQYNIIIVEDAAEALGSSYEGKHLGGLAQIGILSFNGNKLVTSGGGGMIITNDSELAQKAKHLATTAKVAHPWEFYHDSVAYNYRMPNINAAVLLAQLEKIDEFLVIKENIHDSYKSFFNKYDYQIISSAGGTKANHWLNALVLKKPEEKEKLLSEFHSRGIYLRPIWRTLDELPMYKGCIKGDLQRAKTYQQTIVNLPSGVTNNNSYR